MIPFKNKSLYLLCLPTVYVTLAKKQVSGGFSEAPDFFYLDAMQHSMVDASEVKLLLFTALTDMIDDRETFMKGIDYSYYYEHED